MRQPILRSCVLVLALAACSAQQRCTPEAVDSAMDRYRTVRDAEGGKLNRHEAVVRAGMLVSEASTQLATRNYEGCADSLKEADKALEVAERELQRG